MAGDIAKKPFGFKDLAHPSFRNTVRQQIASTLTLVRTGNVPMQAVLFDCIRDAVLLSFGLSSLAMHCIVYLNHDWML